MYHDRRCFAIQKFACLDPERHRQGSFTPPPLTFPTHATHPLIARVEYAIKVISRSSHLTPTPFTPYLPSPATSTTVTTALSSVQLPASQQQQQQQPKNPTDIRRNPDDIQQHPNTPQTLTNHNNKHGSHLPPPARDLVLSRWRRRLLRLPNLPVEQRPGRPRPEAHGEEEHELHERGRA